MRECEAEEEGNVRAEGGDKKATSAKRPFPFSLLSLLSSLFSLLSPTPVLMPPKSRQCRRPTTSIHNLNRKRKFIHMIGRNFNFIDHQ
ncbi:hypothetical protein BVRB_7g167160 [Beta vulgaris subsp. vulgaris]|nr:hypothetical protein BVRB_7g167160 [Beta vulgaris subsp. vulgaris]